MKECDSMIKIGSLEDEKFFVDLTQKLGSDIQTIIAVEELSELIQAVTKLRRGYRDDVYFDNLGEEIAHSLFVINQLIVMFSVGDEVKKYYDKAVKWGRDKL